MNAVSSELNVSVPPRRNRDRAPFVRADGTGFGPWPLQAHRFLSRYGISEHHIRADIVAEAMFLVRQDNHGHWPEPTDSRIVPAVDRVLNERLSGYPHCGAPDPRTATLRLRFVLQPTVGRQELLLRRGAFRQLCERDASGALVPCHPPPDQRMVMHRQTLTYFWQNAGRLVSRLLNAAVRTAQRGISGGGDAR